MLRLLALGTTGRPASLTDGLPGDGRGTPARPRRTSRGCDEWGGEGTFADGHLNTSTTRAQR